MITLHPTPANATAWLRDNARKGAMRYTRNGVTLYLLGTKVTYGDPDKGSVAYPLFAPEGDLRKAYTDTSTKPQID